MVPFAAVLRPTEVLIFDCSAIIIHIQENDAGKTQPVLRTAFHFRLIQVTQLAIDQLLVFFGPGVRSGTA